MERSNSAIVTPSSSPQPLRPMNNPKDELDKPPPVLNFAPLPPVSQRQELLPQQAVATDPRIDVLLQAAKNSQRDNATLQQMFMELLPAVKGQLEMLTSANAVMEENNVQIRASRDQYRENFERLGQELRAEIDTLTQQLAQQQQQIQQQGQDIQGAIQMQGQQIQGAVQQVGQDVNLGRQENQVNFDKVKTQIDDFRQITIDNFNDMKTLIQQAGKNAIAGCYPLGMTNIQEFLNTFFRCLYYFGVFVIYIFNVAKNFYMKFRETIISGLILVFGWIPIPNIDKVLRTIWFLFEVAVIITLINTIGVFFGYPQITRVICQAVFSALKTTIYTFFQFVFWFSMNNPVTTEIIVSVLEGIGFFDAYRWIMAALDTFYTGWISIVAWAEAGQQAQAQAGEWAKWAGIKAGGGKNDLVLYKGFENLDNKYDMTINDYGTNINNLMAYMHSILTGNQDPKMYQYLDTKETRDLANELQRRMSLFENFFINGGFKTFTNSSLIEEIEGGKTRKRYFKKSSKKPKSKKRNIKSKRMCNKRRINRYKSKKRRNNKN